MACGFLLRFSALLHNGYVYMHTNNQFVFVPIELDQNEISTGLKRVVYSFSNTIEHAWKHSVSLKTETERTAHVQ